MRSCSNNPQTKVYMILVNQIKIIRNTFGKFPSLLDTMLDAILDTILDKLLRDI